LLGKKGYVVVVVVVGLSRGISASQIIRLVAAGV